MSDEKRVTEYLIPRNVSTKFEFIEGFGWIELFYVLCACAFGMIFFVLIGIPKISIPLDQFGMTIDENALKDGVVPVKYILKNKINPIFQLLPVFLFGGITFALVKREPSSGLSAFTMVKGMMKFKKKQKRYLYKYKSGSEV